VQGVKKQVEISRQELDLTRQTVNEKIALFNNQIIKLKSDFSIETAEYKKTLDQLLKKLKGNDGLFHDIS
jgi:hypothetical protein